MNVLPFVLIGVMISQSQPAPHPEKITQDEIVQFLLEKTNCKNPDVRLDSTRAPIIIDHLEYFDLTGDGKEEAIVVAFSCLTGTAGWDIKTVFTRDAAGKLIELPLPETNTRDLAGLQGNIGSNLGVKNGLLVSIVGDNTERPEPLTYAIEYRWTGKEFVISAIKRSPYETSYDCTKANKRTERTICQVYDLAVLDLQLHDVYQARLRKLTPEQQKALQEEQRRWLTERNTQCDFAWPDECLKELYHARIGQLRKL
jgi:uncharacterized protein YecT (DUF1311 family)